MNNADRAESPLAASEPTAEELFPTAELSKEPSLLERSAPDNVPFFKMVLYEKLLRRPYHTVRLEGPFKLKKLVAEYHSLIFRSESVVDRNGNQSIESLMLSLDGDVFAFLEDGFFKIYAPTREAAQAVALRFRRYVKPKTETVCPHFHIVSISYEGPRAETVQIERAAPVLAEELALNYGADFLAWEEGWTERMRRSPSGLTILYGPPGCGKTSYLRALMTRLIDEVVFYFVPVSAAEMLSSPRFVNFWVGETSRHKGKQKIAILEDAEQLLLPREAGCGEQVSNLLNIADGFLGDHLKLHVVATTNMPISKLDPAIARPGRLVGAREFRRLSREEALTLAKAKGLALGDQPDYSLAEIYFGAVGDPAINGDRQIGFAQ